MRKSKLYRVGALFMAVLMVITCVPQTALYAAAEELDAVTVQETEAEEPAGGVESQADEEDSLQEETDNSSVQTSQESEGGISPNADDDPAPAPIPVTAITLDRNTLTIQREDTAEFRYTLAPNNANDGTTVTFSSSNDEVASYVVNGNVVTVTAKKVGKAYITAKTSNGLQATCEVEVTPIPVKNVLIDPAHLTLEVGKSSELSVAVDPANADDTRASLRTNYDSSVIEATYDDTTKKITVVAKKAGTTNLAVRSLSNVHIYGSCDITVEGKDVPLTSLSARDGYPKNLYVGSSINLKQYVTYNPVGTTDKELTWSVDSGDGDYAEVDQNGRVTAKWKEGVTDAEKTVKVYAASKADAGKKATFEINIKRNNVPLKALHVTPTELVLEDAGSRNYRTISVQLEPLASTDREITAVVSERNGKSAVVINAGNTYKEESAGKTATAEADVNGRVYFTVKANELERLAEQDTCTITFTKKGADPALASTIKVRCDVTVNKYVTPVEKLELQPESLTMMDGDVESLTAVIGPLTAEDRNIVWTVDDPEIAEIIEGVDADGRVEATLDTNGDLSATVKVKANMVGECEITATAAGDVKRTCKVNVKNGTIPADGLMITSDGIEITEITLKKGQTYDLIPEVTPGDATNKKVKWSASGDSAVASVEKVAGEVGRVTAKELGVCTITARASGESSACTKTVLVHVVAPHMEVSYKGAPEKWSYVPEDQPITEEMLRRELDVFFWPIEKPVPEEDRWTLGSGEAHDYDLRILREDGTSEKNYTPEDMEKPGIKTLVISYAYEGVTYKGSVQVEMKEFDEADLISVTQLSGEDAEVWNVPNGTPASALPLAKTTEILVGRKVSVEGQEELRTAKLDAEIEWDVAASGYNSADSEAQEFTVFGNVVLPDYVSNSNNVSRRVQAVVHVREYASSGKKTVRPSFAVLDGEQIGSRTSVTVPYGSKIVIETATDEADIYYMVDRRPDENRGVPQDEEHKYSSPIEITAKTTTIYAIAVKAGYSDSDCSECTIKLVQAQEIDPDDPDAPLPDDVTDEDREQIGGKVPNGLWAVVQMDAAEKKEGGFAYTGSAIKPAVHVYDRTMLLTEKKDYTIAYSNNINAGSAVGSAKPPTITVTGKGNYEGKAVVRFTIKPQDITDDSVFMDEYVAVAYNKKAQKPNPALTWNGKKLSKNKDYTYADVSYTESGIYKVTVEGKGNYTGSRTMDYEIYDSGVAVSKLTISKVANYKYTGQEIRPTVEVKYKNTLLSEGTEKGNTGNYWIKYENCTKVGTASLVIIGKGHYKGSKRINFKILPVAKISQAGITLDVPAAGIAYTGKPHTPKCTVNYLGMELKENKDYKLSYQNNTKAGTATVVLTGMGAYNGTAKKTFKILQNDISGLAAVMGTSFTYEKGGCKPKPTITYNGMELKAGTDYTLTYKNHNKIGNTASVTVKGKGNYKGQIVRYFEVTMQDISKLKVVASDKAYQNKKNIYKTKVQVIDLNGKALVAGTDYSKDIYYTYESGTKAGQPVLSTDIIPAGTVIGVDVRVANPRCYQGTVHGTYRIVQANISGAKVSINPQEYTGRSIRPKKSQIQVTLNGVLLGNDDYEIVSYENNVNQGNAKITIRGVGSYGGTKTATFKIKKKGILNLKF